jgi:hypothetical protein
MEAACCIDKFTGSAKYSFSAWGAGMSFTLGTIISVMGGIKSAADTYRSVSALVYGVGTDRVVAELRGLRKDLVKLNDDIHWARDWRSLTDTERASQHLSDARAAAELLDPVQRALKGPVVSSGIIEAPLKLQEVLARNPKGVLDDITRFEWVEGHANPDKVPVMFLFEGVRYVGWQKRDVLPFLLNCELHDLPGLAPRPPQQTPVVTSARAAVAASPSPQVAEPETKPSRAGLGKGAAIERAPAPAKIDSTPAAMPPARSGGRFVWLALALAAAAAVYFATSSRTHRDDAPYRSTGGRTR